jgi:hypothetical protein
VGGAASLAGAALVGAASIVISGWLLNGVEDANGGLLGAGSAAACDHPAVPAARVTHTGAKEGLSPDSHECRLFRIFEQAIREAQARGTRNPP